MTHYTNGASPRPDKHVLLQCKNLTHLHQIFDFKIYRIKTGTGPAYFAGTLIIMEGPAIETGVDMVEHWTISAAKAYGPLTLPNGSTF